MSRVLQLTLICFILLSCRKDVVTADTFFEAKPLKIGDYSKVEVTELNYAHQYYEYMMPYEFDLNSDGVNDFVLSGSIYSAAASYIHSLTLSPKHNSAFVLSTTYEESLYYHIDTVYNAGTNVVYWTIQETISCANPYNSDSIVQTTNHRYPTSLAENTVIDSLSSWSSAACFISGSQSKSTSGQVINADTNQVFIKSTIQNCNEPLDSLYHYFGLRVINQTSDKLGWIKLKPNNQGNPISGSILIEEIAVQN